MYDIEVNNVKNPKDELEAKLSAARNIGGAAIAGSVAFDLKQPLVHHVHVTHGPTATHVEHKF